MSTTPSSADVGAIALGAAIFDEEQIQPFAQAFRALYDEFEVPHDIELKWSNPQG